MPFIVQVTVRSREEERRRNSWGERAPGGTEGARPHAEEVAVPSREQGTTEGVPRRGGLAEHPVRGVHPSEEKQTGVLGENTCSWK